MFFLGLGCGESDVFYRCMPRGQVESAGCAVFKCCLYD